MKVKFNSLIDAINFSQFIDKNLTNSDVNIISGNICIDAKSILGIANLDVTKTYNIEIIGSNEDYQLLKNYIITGGK